MASDKQIVIEWLELYKKNLNNSSVEEIVAASERRIELEKGSHNLRVLIETDEKRREFLDSIQEKEDFLQNQIAVLGEEHAEGNLNDAQYEAKKKELVKRLTAVQEFYAELYDEPDVFTYFLETGIILT